MPGDEKQTSPGQSENEQESQDKPLKHITTLGGVPVDLDFIKSYCGILELVTCRQRPVVSSFFAVQVLSLIAFICSHSGGYCDNIRGTVSFFNSISISTFITMLLWWLHFVFILVERLRVVPWRFCEMIALALFGGVYLIADIMIVAIPCNIAAYKFAGAFGFFSFFAICVHFYLSFQLYRHTERPYLTQQSAHVRSPVVL